MSPAPAAGRAHATSGCAEPQSRVVAPSLIIRLFGERAKMGRRSLHRGQGTARGFAVARGRLEVALGAVEVGAVELVAGAGVACAELSGIIVEI